MFIDLTNESIKRFARKAGILYISKTAYRPIQLAFNAKRDEILYRLGNIVKNRNDTRIKSGDLELLHLIDLFINDTSEQFNQNEDISSISIQTKNITEYMFPHTTFKRNIVERNQQLNQLKLSSNFMNNLHLYIENYIHYILVKAHSIMKLESKKYSDLGNIITHLID